MKTLTITKPDDAHLHLRDGDYLATTVAHTAQRFARAIVMPNLKPALVSVDQVQAYRSRILAMIPAHQHFQPLMTLYLTENLPLATLHAAKACGFIIGVKLYPAGVTTHSEAGVKDLKPIYPILEVMQEIGLPLLIHGEANDPAIDIFDRERYFLDDLAQLNNHFPQLRMVLEHITTQYAVQFILSQSHQNVAATITAHHLLLNRNDLLAGGIHPHYYCLPILKRRHHQEALLAAATSGDPRFFLGTDSAPHTIATKESACGCAGIYTAHAAIELYAEIFEQADALNKLEAFASHHAADFYHLPRNEEQISLVKKPWQVPKSFAFGTEQLVPFRADAEVGWQIA